MKKITIIATVIITFAASGSFCQSDSTMYINKADFTLFRIQKVKYQDSDEIKLEKQFTNLEDISALSFMSNDSLGLFTNSGAPVYTGISNISEVIKYKYRFSPVLGITIGAVGGGLIGAIIGSAVTGNSGGIMSYPEQILYGVEKASGGLIGAIVGAVGGGIIGALISSAINHSSLDLFSVPDKHKKSKLIKFLKEK